MPKTPLLAPAAVTPSGRTGSDGARRQPKAPAATAGAAERVAWVDTAKGFCIILVVMMHSTLGLGEAVGREGWLHVAVQFAQPFRIPAFFLIAGLFLARTIDEPWARFLDRKVLHFVYFYLLWTIIQCVVKFGPGGGFAGVTEQVARALIEPFGTLWFIYLLPIFLVVTKLARRAPAWILIAEAIAMNAWPHATGFTAIDEFMSRYVFFLSGYLFAPAIFAFAETAQRNRDVIIAATGAVFALIAAFVFATDNLIVSGSLARAPGVALALGAAGALALVATSALIAPTLAGRAIRFCGERSLAIYLAFFLPMAAMRMLLVKSGAVGGVLDVGTASAIVTASAILLPLLLHRLVVGGMFGWLFERPSWARFAPSRESGARLQAAA